MRLSTPVDGPLWPIDIDGYNDFINELCENIDEAWDDDVAAEAIILRYVHHLESLLTPEQRLPPMID